MQNSSSKLPHEKVLAVLEHLAEGCGVRQTARLVGGNKDTVTRLALLAGKHAEAAHDELSRLIGPVLKVAGVTKPRRLPPRVQQTLDCLLQGDSEKRVALRLGLSRATVHQYVTDLYRRLGVHTRAELLAKFVR